MKITNNYNLPHTLINAIQAHEHKSIADISVSQLTKSPRELWLTRRHFNEINIDATEQIWAVTGTLGHSVIEKGESMNALAEEEFQEVKIGKYTISGIVDLYEDGYIHDWKFTTVWTLLMLDDFKKAVYISQLNSYATFFRMKDWEVKGVKIHLIMRDWTKSKSYSKDYPANQIKTIEFPLYSQEQVISYMTNRVDYLMSFKDVPDDELPLCSDVYRWVKPSKWALMKKGRKTAVKLFDNKQDATNAMSDPKHYLEERKEDLWKHCQYCPARKFCNQTQYEEQPMRENKELKINMSYEKFLEEIKNA